MLSVLAMYTNIKLKVLFKHISLSYIMCPYNTHVGMSCMHDVSGRHQIMATMMHTYFLFVIFHFKTSDTM